MSIYEQAPDSTRTAGNPATQAVSRLHGLARVGAAATDTCLNIDLHKGGYQELFEAMHDIADGLFGHIETLERMAGLPISGTINKADLAEAPVAIYEEWKATNDLWNATAAAQPRAAEDVPEVQALADQTDALSKKLAASKPRSTADCAALMQWVTHEIGEGLDDPTHHMAQRSVTEYLQKLQPKTGGEKPANIAG